LFCSGLNSRQYYRDCYIEGTTDFIFGPSTVVFQNCRIHSKKNSHVTAASTPAESAFGFVFFDCELTGDTSLHNVSLGRPWRPYASVTYIRCKLGPHIIPEGWNNWKNPANEKTARYAEYKNSGPGANPSQRASWGTQLNSEQLRKYTLKNIFGDWSPPFQ
jgi:pectinesterase